MATEKDPRPPKGGKPKPRVSNSRPAGISGAAQSLPSIISAGVDPLRQGINGVGSAANYLASRPDAPQGGGLGDRLFSFLPPVPRPYISGPAFGSKSMGSTSARRFQHPGFQRDGGEAEQQKSLADYLAQAAAMLSGQGGGGVNYDPQRNAARSLAADSDARLEAMYRQLRGSIDADAPVIQQAYQNAIDSTASIAQNAQQQTQAATDSANARNDQVLANLGIQQAAGNQIQEGRDLSSQTAEQIGDQASRGQAAGTLLASNQATALAHNTNIGNAAGLEGNLQRAANQSKLQALLAQIDMEEQQQNASRQQDSFSRQLQLANSFLDFDRYNQEREDARGQSMAELMNDRDIAQMQAQSKQLPDLGTYLQAIGQDSTWLRDNPQDAARLLDVLRRFGIQQ